MADPAVFARLASAMSSHTLCRYAFPVSSGTAALYLILKAIMPRPGRTEVVLPAYTAGSLVVAIRKAGLVPVPADISLRDFNGDARAMASAVSERTLAVVAVHMFGIGMDTISDLKRSIGSGAVLIEDCCQAMGSSIGSKTVGALGDVSFFSFGRGKNLSACGGGCIMTDDGSLARSLDAVTGGLRPAGHLAVARQLAAAAAVGLAVNPWIYGLLGPVVSRFKETAPPLDFDIAQISGFQAALALAGIAGLRDAVSRRNEHGGFLMKELRDLPGLRLPEPGHGDRPAYNRFPVLFEDRLRLERALDAVRRAGAEGSRMYSRPLHHMFDLGRRKDELPNACYLAERLITLPVYPSVDRRAIAAMAEAVRRSVR
jgi:dTDP-4-amino-4,6-dideoxygalactose transaminase